MWSLLQVVASGLLAAFQSDPLQVQSQRCRYAGVVHVEGSTPYSLTFLQAVDLCEGLGNSLATEEQVRVAYSKGLETCRYGWISTQILTMLRHEAHPDCASNLTGVMFHAGAADSQYDAYCFNASDISDVSCEDAIHSSPNASVNTYSTERDTARTSKPGSYDDILEEAKTEGFIVDEVGTETPVSSNTTAQADHVTSIPVNLNPEVQHPTSSPEEDSIGTTKPVVTALAHPDVIDKDPRAPVEHTTVNPASKTFPTAGTEQNDEAKEANPDLPNIVAAEGGADPPTPTTTSGPVEASSITPGLLFPDAEDTDGSGAWLQPENPERNDFTTKSTTIGKVEETEAPPNKELDVPKEVPEQDDFTTKSTTIGKVEETMAPPNKELDVPKEVPEQDDFTTKSTTIGKVEETEAPPNKELDVPKEVPEQDDFTTKSTTIGKVEETEAPPNKELDVPIEVPEQDDFTTKSTTIGKVEETMAPPNIELDVPKEVPEQDDFTTKMTTIGKVEETMAPPNKELDIQQKVPEQDAPTKVPAPPKGRMFPGAMGPGTVLPSPSAQEEAGTPGWLIIFAFIMVVAALLCVFAAVATKHKWYGPRRSLTVSSKQASEGNGKAAAMIVYGSEMVTLMSKENGKMEECTVISLEEPQEKANLV